MILSSLHKYFKATMNEVKVLAMLRHPNIIEYRESFLHERAMMIVMEYAAGGSLHDLIQERANDGKELHENPSGFFKKQFNT